MDKSITFARKELGAFLRSRRERRTPAEAGLGVVGHRRTPGLRREEVARLAGVSLTWYTWLEQGRNIRVSRQVLASIARTLSLTGAERDYLFSLAAEDKPAAPALERPPLDADIREFLAMLDPFPSWIFDQYFNIIGWNRSAAGLLAGIDELPVDELNAIRLMFTDPSSRHLLPEWENEARRLVSLLRAETAAAGGDPRHAAMISDLRERSPDFRRLWDSRDVLSFTPSVRRFRHPSVGLLELRYLRFDLPGEYRRSVIIHFLPTDSPDLPRLWKLTGTAPRSVPALPAKLLVHFP